MHMHGTNVILGRKIQQRGHVIGDELNSWQISDIPVRWGDKKLLLTCLFLTKRCWSGDRGLELPPGTHTKRRCKSLRIWANRRANIPSQDRFWRGVKDISLRSLFIYYGVQDTTQLAAAFVGIITFFSINQRLFTPCFALVFLFPCQKCAKSVKVGKQTSSRSSHGALPGISHSDLTASELGAEVNPGYYTLVGVFMRLFWLELQANSSFLQHTGLLSACVTTVLPSEGGVTPHT